MSEKPKCKQCGKELKTIDVTFDGVTTTLVTEGSFSPPDDYFCSIQCVYEYAGEPDDQQ